MMEDSKQVAQAPAEDADPASIDPPSSEMEDARAASADAPRAEGDGDDDASADAPSSETGGADAASADAPSAEPAVDDAASPDAPGAEPGEADPAPVDPPSPDSEAPERARPDGAPPSGAPPPLQADFNLLREQYLRLAADFDNHRRRAEQERKRAWGRAQSDLLACLLDSLDDLERINQVDAGEATAEGLLQGIELVTRKLFGSLREAGVETLDPAGEPFDPEVMEGMMRVPAEEKEEDERVHQVFQKGYRLKGHLVRPARVSVKKYG